MTVHLTPELEQLIQSKVNSGRYNSPSEVVQEALLLLSQRDEVFTPHKDEMRKQIEEGWQSARLGEFADGDEVFDRMTPHSRRWSTLLRNEEFRSHQAGGTGLRSNQELSR